MSANRKEASLHTTNCIRGMFGVGCHWRLVRQCWSAGGLRNQSHAGGQAASGTRYLVLLHCLLGMALCVTTGCGGCNRNQPAAAPTAAKPPVVAPDEFKLTPELVAEHNVGVGHMGKFEFAPAQAIFADLAKRHPNWADVKVDLAIATFNQQKPDESFASQYIVDSLAILDDVLKTAHEHLRGRYCKGVLLYYLGKTDEALSHFAFVAGKDPGDAFATYFVGRCLFNEGKFDEALAHYQQAIDRDPYFASAYYAAFQTLQRLRKPDEAKAMMADFQKLEGNPQARKEAMKYTRMGAKADVVAIAIPIAKPIEEPLEFLDTSQSFPAKAGSRWRFPDTSINDDNRSKPHTSLTACDINGDGRLDLFAAAALTSDGFRNGVFLQHRSGQFELATDHPLANVVDVSAAAWGDYDNDGLTDVYLGRKGANQLWRQSAPNVWEDVTASTGTAAGESLTIDTMMIDFDHDGDLDLVVLNEDGTRYIFSNNRDATFRALGVESGIGRGAPHIAFGSILAADIDSDRDVDLAFPGAERTRGAYVNDRLWKFKPDWQFDNLLGYGGGAVAVDHNSDGRIEIMNLSGPYLVKWTRGTSALWDSSPGYKLKLPSPPSYDPRRRIAAVDFDGDALLDIAADSGHHIVVQSLEHETSLLELNVEHLLVWTIAPLDGMHPSLVTFAREGEEFVLKTHTPHQRTFASLTFSGKEEKQDEMRSNRSGIGVKVNARIGSKWFSAETFRNDSGPGQSLMPLSFGTAGADKIDFVMLHWSDGVFQTETNLEAGKLHRIEETQRQTSSCPLLFVWDGEKFAFVTDLLGVGGIGFNIGHGEYPPPDPTENLLLPEAVAAPRDGRYVLKLHEPMEEATYLDHAQLAIHDLPPGWQLVLDERFGASDPQPTGEAIYYRDELSPSRVLSDRGEDVTSVVSEVDNQAAPPGPRDSRFVGRTERSTLELEFATPLDAHAGAPVLIADGWVEYPYSQTMFAAWQAGAKYAAPTLEARDADSVWQVVHQEFGYPAGMPRRMALPLNNLPNGTTALRLSTTYEVYWDRLAVAFSEPCPEARRVVIPAENAKLARTGFPLRTNGQQRRPYYDYQQRAPFDDMRHQAGWYTEFGNVAELVSQADDALAVFGPGEEVHLEFAAPEPPPQGWRRRLVLETVGWCKDMDLMTADGDTVEPLPRRAMDTSSEAKQLHKRTRTRYESGD